MCRDDLSSALSTTRGEVRGEGREEVEWPLKSLPSPTSVLLARPVNCLRIVPAKRKEKGGERRREGRGGGSSYRGESQYIRTVTHIHVYTRRYPAGTCTCI